MKPFSSTVGGTTGQAYTLAGATVHRVERSLPGQVQFVNNLSDKLNTAAGDALYAETLYIMLAVPGALVALGLAYLAALGTVDAVETAWNRALDEMPQIRDAILHGMAHRIHELDRRI